MRKASRIWLSAAALALFSAENTPGQPPDAAQPIAVTIEFQADHKCSVTASGGGFHASLTYTQPAVDSTEYRCALPPVPPGRSVSLTVTLAEGARPSGVSNPPLTWSEKNGRAVGTAIVATPPEVVVVQDWDNPDARRGRLMRRIGMGLLAVALAAAAALAFVRRRGLRRSL